MQYLDEWKFDRPHTRAYIRAMTTIGHRLDQAMRAAGFISQKKLEEASNVPQPTISRILKDKGKKGPESATIKLLADACAVSFLWLYEGLGPMEPQGDALSGIIKVDSDSEDAKFVGIKLVTRQVFLGVDGVDADWEYEDEVSLSVPYDWLRSKRLLPSELFAFRASGQSMFPTIRDGAVIVATKADTSPVDGKLFVVNHNGRPVVKRMEREGEIWYLSSDNPAPEFRRRALNNDSRIIGRVLRMETDFD